MLWRGVDITTFPTPTLWGWVDGLEEEIKTIRAEIDRRAVGAVNPPTEGRATTLIKEITADPDSHYVVKGVGRMDKADPPTDRTFQRPGGVVPSVRPALTDRGAPPRRDEGEG